VFGAVVLPLSLARRVKGRGVWGGGKSAGRTTGLNTEPRARIRRPTSAYPGASDSSDARTGPAHRRRRAHGATRAPKAAGPDRRGRLRSSNLSIFAAFSRPGGGDSRCCRASRGRTGPGPAWTRRGGGEEGARGERERARERVRTRFWIRRPPCGVLALGEDSARASDSRCSRGGRWWGSCCWRRRGARRSRRSPAHGGGNGGGKRVRRGRGGEKEPIASRASARGRRGRGARRRGRAVRGAPATHASDGDVLLGGLAAGGGVAVVPARWGGGKGGQGQGAFFEGLDLHWSTHHLLTVGIRRVASRPKAEPTRAARTTRVVRILEGVEEDLSEGEAKIRPEPN
jgi:hypothetical protein